MTASAELRQLIADDDADATVFTGDALAYWLVNRAVLLADLIDAAEKQATVYPERTIFDLDDALAALEGDSDA